MAITEQTDWRVEIPSPSEREASYRLTLGGDFFAAAANPDLRGGAVTADVEIRRSGGMLRVAMRCRGTVATDCDRCMEPMEVSVDDTYEAPLLPSPRGLTPAGDDSDSLWYDPATGLADLLRPLADTLALGLGLTRRHPDGLCDPEVTRILDAGAESADGSYDGNDGDGQDGTPGSPLAQALRQVLRENDSTNNKKEK